MSSAVRLQLAVDADTTDAAAAFDKVGQAARDMANDVDAAARDADQSTASFADSADNAGGAAATAAGAFGDLGGALAMMPGPLGALGAGMETAAPAIQGLTGATDLFTLAANSSLVSTVKNTAATVVSTAAKVATTVATQAMAAAQWLLNAAMSANPIGLVVIALVALVAALVIAYKKSETFRNIVQAAMGAVKAAVQVVATFLKTAFKVAFTLVTGYVNAYRAVAVAAWGLVKAAIGAIPEVIRKVIDWIGRIKVPGVIKRTFDDVHDAIGFVITKITDLVKKLGGFSVPKVIKDLADPFTTAKDAVGDLIDKIDSLIGWLGRIKFPSVPKGISSILPGRAVPASGAGGTRSGPAPGVTAAGAPSGGVTIVIQGAVDSYQTALQIRRVLARGALIGGRVTP